MDGWGRLKLVLSLLYWAWASIPIYLTTANMGADDGAMAALVFGLGYLALAGIWWAFSAFRWGRRS